MIAGQRCVHTALLRRERGTLNVYLMPSRRDVFTMESHALRPSMVTATQEWLATKCERQADRMKIVPKADGYLSKTGTV